MNEIQLSPTDQTLKTKLLAQQKVSEAELQALFLARQQAEEKAAKALRGTLFYIAEGTHILVIEEYPSGKRLAAVPLAKHKNANPEYWGNTLILINPEDGKELELLPSDTFKQGLLQTRTQTLIHPFAADDPYLGLSRTFYSPEKTTNSWEAFDLTLCPELQLLFVVHRGQGRLSVVDIAKGRLLQQFQLRKPGHLKTLNLAIDAGNAKAYVTDNFSQTLFVLDLKTLKLSSFQTSLGILGNLALSPNSRYLYLTILKPKFSLTYLQVDSLSHTRELDLKGDSLCLNGPLPADLMHMTPDGKFLLFMTCLDTPKPRTPVIQVVDTGLTRTVRRYAIKEGGGPHLLATATPNPAFLEPFDLARALLAQGRLRPDELQALIDQPLTHYSIYDEESSTVAEATPAAPSVPSISLPPDAELVILQRLSQALEQQVGIVAEAQPLVLRQLREMAVELKTDLEIELSTQLELEMSGGRALSLELGRAELIQAMQQLPKPPNPLFLPVGNCPICGKPKAAALCSHCGFKLDTAVKPQKAERQIKIATQELITKPKFSQDDYISLLKRVSFLAGASFELLQELTQCLVSETIPKGKRLIEEGKMGSSLYFVAEGQLAITRGKDPEPVAMLQEGDVVGEMAVILSEPRSAHVTAQRETSLLRLERHDFLKVVQRHPAFSRQLRELAYQRKDLLQKMHKSKSVEVMDRIKARMAIQKLQALPLFTSAPAAFFEDLALQVQTSAFLPRKVVFEEGDKADRLYFILQGKVNVIIHGEQVASLSEGELFGEMAWLLQQPRNATVKTEVYSKFLELNHESFAEVVQKYPEIQKRVQALAAVRQAELKAQFVPLDQPQAMALPGLRSGGQGYQPPEDLYFLSAAKEALFALEGQQIKWSLGQDGQLRLFQPFRVSSVQGTQELLLLADTGNDRILAVNPRSRSVVQVWGDHQLSLSYPRSAELSPEGWLLVADEGYQRLVVVDRKQEIIWSHSQNIISPQHASYTPEGNILYTDAALNQVIEINRKGEVVWVYGAYLIAGSGPGELSRPSFAMRLNNGLTLIADTGNDRLVWVDVQAEPYAIWQGNAQMPLNEPFHLEWDSAGYLYAHGLQDERMVCFSPDGQPVWQASLSSA